jgi:hypothetical protein
MPNRVQTAIDLLRQALGYSKRHNQPARAHRIRKGIDDLTPTPPPPPPPPATKTIYPAITAARQQSHNGPQFGTGECMMRVRMCYGRPSIGDFDGDGSADAEDGWKAAHVKHGPNVPSKRGYPVFWTGGSNDNGHVAIAAGEGMCWSTDIRRPGFFDFVPITEIRDKWGLTYVGWAEDLAGVPLDPAVEVPVS